jgi:hypothetical protein
MFSGLKQESLNRSPRKSHQPMKTKYNPFLAKFLIATAALGVASAYAADMTLTGSSAINGMNTDYTVTRTAWWITPA